MRAEDELLEHADAAAFAEARFADRLNVEMEGHRLVDLRQRPGLAVGDVVADAHAVAPYRMLVAEPDHVEVVQRRERDAQLLARGAPQDDLGAPRVAGPGLELEPVIHPGRRLRS